MTGKIKFLRRDGVRYSKLGKKRKKKQVWRRPTGRDNKMREKRKGYPSRVSVGYKKEKNPKNKIDKEKFVLIRNVFDLEKINKNENIVISKVGKKKKIEIVKKAKELKIKINNLNIEKFLKKSEKKNESK